MRQRTADLTREIARHEETQKQLEDSNRELQLSLERLRQQTREMALLHEMSELLQAASTAEEYNKVISHAMQQLFNTKVGALYALRPSHDLIEASITWCLAYNRPVKNSHQRNLGILCRRDYS